MIYIVQNLLNYAAPYPGNFINSLICLEHELTEMNIGMVYLFPKKAEGLEWLNKMVEEGHKVFYGASGDEKIYETIALEYPISIIHSHFAFTEEYKAINRFVRRHPEVKTVFHHHDAEFMPYKEKGYGIILESIRKWKNVLALQLAKRRIKSDVHIACGKGPMADLEKKGFKNLVCIENAIDFGRLDKYEHLDKESVANERYNRFFALAFGYDFYIKGIDLAIDAVQELADRYGLTLGIVVAKKKEEAEKYIIGKYGGIPLWIKLLPPRQDVASYYHMADLFLSPSRTEGMSYAVIESIYCGCSTVVSDIPGLAHAAEIPGTRVFECGSSKMLKTEIESFLLFGDTYKEEVSALVKERYSPERWSYETIKVYTSLLEKDGVM